MFRKQYCAICGKIMDEAIEPVHYKDGHPICDHCAEEGIFSPSTIRCEHCGTVFLQVAIKPVVLKNGRYLYLCPHCKRDMESVMTKEEWEERIKTPEAIRIEVGQTVFLAPWGNFTRMSYKPHSEVITKVGRKYFYVETEGVKIDRETMKSDIANGGWICYPNEAAYLVQEKKREQERFLYRTLDTNHVMRRLTPFQVNQIYEMVKEALGQEEM